MTVRKPRSGKQTDKKFGYFNDKLKRNITSQNDLSYQEIYVLR